MRDTKFYNEESARYSRTRYPATAASYTQFFYLRRLRIVRSLLSRILKSGSQTTLLEIGCADGIVLRKLAGSFPCRFSRMVGIDIAQRMVEEARAQTAVPHARFCLRNELPARERFDVVLEVGVANYARLEEELSFAGEHMQSDGYYILSLAGTGSLRNRIKGEDGFSDFRPYRVYEEIIRRDFVIEKAAGCGVFVPLLWRVPALARVVQPVCEAVANTLFLQGLCHENIYLLKKRAHDAV